MPQRRYRFLQLDVFTDHVFGGNQLAVFPQAEGLSDAQMQAVAGEMNYSETTFVLPATDPAAQCRVRIFTPGTELPFAGHPVVGTAIALAHEGRIAPGEDGSAHMRFQLGVGTLPVEIRFADGRAQFAWMSQPLPAFEPWRGDPTRLAAALGLEPDELRVEDLPIERGTAGVPFVYTPIRSLAVMGHARPTADLTAVLDASRCQGAYLFTLPGGGAATARVRMFASPLGIVEDPATGGAAGPFGAYLLRHGRIAAGEDGVAPALVEQGVELRRPSRLYVEVEGAPEAIRSVRVGGQAVLVAEGALLLEGE